MKALPGPVPVSISESVPVSLFSVSVPVSVPLSLNQPCREAPGGPKKQKEGSVHMRSSRIQRMGGEGTTLPSCQHGRALTPQSTGPRDPTPPPTKSQVQLVRQPRVTASTQDSELEHFCSHHRIPALLRRGWACPPVYPSSPFPHRTSHSHARLSLCLLGSPGGKHHDVRTLSQGRQSRQLGRVKVSLTGKQPP